jgi:hypothetical protein
MASKKAAWLERSSQSGLLLSLNPGATDIQSATVLYTYYSRFAFNSYGASILLTL